MSIQVRSNDPAPEAVVSTASKEGAAASSEGASEQKSAPESEDSEQNTSESETDESESVEASDESEGEPSEDGESKETEKAKPKAKGGFQRRIDKLNARNARAEEQAEYWRQLALKNGAGEPKQNQVEQSPRATEGRPDPDKFDTHQEWVEAVADWKAEQKFAEREQQSRKRALEVEQTNVLKSHSDRVRAFSDKTPDFADVLESVDDVPVSAVIENLLITSENGPELIYALAKNRAEFERINKLQPLPAARALGRLESLIASSGSETKTESKKLTSAPKPLAPVGKASTSGITKSIADPSLSQADYERIRREQMKRKHA